MGMVRSHKGYSWDFCFSQLTCRLSIGGITMTKLSGKRPQRPFSSPSHQPSSSASFRWRLKSHIRSSSTPVSFGTWNYCTRGYQTVKQNTATLSSIHQRRYLFFFFFFMIPYYLDNCHICVVKTNVRHPVHCGTQFPWKRHNWFGWMNTMIHIQLLCKKGNYTVRSLQC